MTQLGNPQARPPGRPSALTPDAIQRVVSLAELGGTQVMCAQAIGVSARTFARWLADGRQARDLGQDTPEARLLLMFERARAGRFEDALKTLKSVEAGAEKSSDRLRASTWLLERQGGYAEAVKVEHSGPGGAPLPGGGPDWSGALSLLSDAELAEVGQLQRRVRELLDGAKARAAEQAEQA